MEPPERLVFAEERAPTHYLKVIVSGRIDETLAKLFAWSGWTQEELATKEHKAPQHIARALRFGRFLNFSPTGENPETLPKSLSERRFREYWERTDKTETNERIRFVAVQRFIAAEVSLRRGNRPRISPAIIERFADGVGARAKAEGRR